jgi:hypothetical protein
LPGNRREAAAFKRILFEMSLYGYETNSMH